MSTAASDSHTHQAMALYLRLDSECIVVTTTLFIERPTYLFNRVYNH